MATEKRNLPGFKILPAAEEDCLALAKLWSTANCEVDDPGAREFLTILFGKPTNEYIQTRAENYREKTMRNPNTRFWKAIVEENGEEKIVGWTYCVWHTEIKPIEWKDFEWPAPANSDAANRTMRDITEARARQMTGKQFCSVEVLCTAAPYRNRGIGSALVNTVLKAGRAIGLVNFYVDSSPLGRTVYEQCGFREVERFPIELQKYGGTANSELTVLTITNTE